MDRSETIVHPDGVADTIPSETLRTFTSIARDLRCATGKYETEIAADKRLAEPKYDQELAWNLARGAYGDMTDQPRLVTDAINDDSLMNGFNVQLDAWNDPLIHCLRRYRNVAFENWILFYLLIQSKTFRQAVEDYDQHNWEQLLVLLRRESTTIQFIGRIHGIRLEPLIRNHFFVDAFHSDKFEVGPILNHNIVNGLNPSQWMDYFEVDKPKGEFIQTAHNGIPINLHNDNNLYNEEDWNLWTGPEGWPQGMEYPQDPSKISPEDFDKFCEDCDTWNDCVCNPSSGPTKRCNLPQAQLRNYRNKGTGVRVLQDLPAKQYLGEYVGELHPPNSVHRSLYMVCSQFHYCIPSFPTDSFLDGSGLRPKLLLPDPRAHRRRDRGQLDTLHQSQLRAQLPLHHRVVGWSLACHARHFSENQHVGRTHGRLR